MKKIFLTFILLTTTFSIFSQNRDFYSSEMTKKFADDLYVNGFFEEAGSEYMRYMFMTEKPDFGAFDNLTNIFRNTKNYEKIDWLEQYKSIYPQENSGKFNFIHAESMFARKLPFPYQNNFFDSDSHQLIVSLSNEILNFNYKKCVEQINSFYPDPESAKKEFTILKEQCQNYSEKSPLLALSLSAILPGSGKWYGDSFRSGFGSFLSIGIAGAGTYWCYKEYGISSWRTIALGSSTVISYIVELYGSYQNAKRVNAAKQNNIRNTMSKIYEMEY